MVATPNVPLGTLDEFLGHTSGSLRRMSIHDLVPYGKFLVHRNGTDQTGATANADNKIQFTTKAVDTDSIFDNVTNFRYLPLRSGWYEVTLFARAQAISNAPLALIYKNGARVAAGVYNSAATATEFHSMVSTYVFCNGSTDYIEAYCFLPTGVTTISGQTISTYFFGRRFSP